MRATNVIQINFADRQKRISDRIHMVKPIAAALHRGLPNGAIDLDDLIQIGFLGLIAACDNQDPSQPLIAFEFYVRCRIQGEIRDEIRRRYRSHQRLSIVPDATDEGTTLVERYPDTRPLHDAEYEMREAVEHLKILPATHRQVVEFRLQNLTYTEIGAKLGLSAPDARKIELQAIARVRAWMNRPRTMAA